MNVSEVMNNEAIFCTADMRVSEIKYLLKKYDYDEIVVIDSEEERHPIGVISLADMDTEEVESMDIPSDASAVDCMRIIPAVIYQTTSLEESLNVMRSNAMEHLAVVDLNGHITGVLDKKSVTNILM
jgi:CBS domain-containing protein